jgi:hypothetical protein
LRTVLKKLLVWAVVLLVALAFAGPAFAITASSGGETADTDSPTGPYTAKDCPTLQENQDVWNLDVSMFPGLASMCP